MVPQSSGSTQDTRTQTAALAQQNLSPPDTQQRPLTSPPAPSSKTGGVGQGSAVT